MGRNFCEKLEEASRSKFHGFKFRGAIDRGYVMWTLILGHRERIFVSTRKDGTLQC